MRLLIGPNEVDEFLCALSREGIFLEIYRYTETDSSGRLHLKWRNASSFLKGWGRWFSRLEEYLYPLLNRAGLSTREMYNEYMRSDAWDARRDRIMRKRGPACEHCGWNGVVQLHHLTYERLYEELDEDLELLCISCHEAADERRKYEKAFRTWARKVRCVEVDELDCERDKARLRRMFDHWYTGKGGVVPEPSR